MRVLLGPSHELHAGVHGSLTDWPVPEVEYVERTYSMHFQHRRCTGPPFSPVHDLSDCEWLRFDREDDIDLVHAARFPVDTCLPWVVDADCLVLPLRFGTFFAYGMHYGAPRPNEKQIKQREALMAARYAEPRCGRIMLRSEHAKRHFLQVIADNHLIDGYTRDALAEKAQVIYPAVRAAPLSPNRQGHPRLLFMGRTFLDKGGLLLVAVLEQLRLLHGHSLEATVVAPCPPAVKARLSSLGVDVQPIGDRNEYLSRLARADIFFSPTLFENFGMGLLEACAAGAAIVTSCGPGMEHIGELFRDGKEALLVSNALAEEARVAAYVDAVAMLICDADLRRKLGCNAHAMVSEGRFSLARRNRDLAEIYNAALNSTPANSVSAPLCGSQAPSGSSSNVLIWSEHLCHWTMQRHAPQGSLRICV